MHSEHDMSSRSVTAVLLLASCAVSGAAEAAPRADQRAAAVTTLMESLAETCLNRAGRLLLTEIAAAQERSPQEIKGGQQEIRAALDRSVQDIRSGQNDSVEEIRREIREGQQAVQDQLAGLQARLSAWSAPEECPSGWSRHGSACYTIPPQRGTWFEAHGQCAQLDRRARLASVHPGSADYLRALVEASDTEAVWIGLSRMTGNPGWGWSDGTPLDFVRWRETEPNNAEERCVHYWGPRVDYQDWNDHLCTKVFNMLCQITLE